MAFGMLQSNTAPIALEFGVGSLKALQLAPGEPPSLVAAACLETPEELRADHEARLAFQCEHVAGLLKNGGFKGKRVMCSIPAPFTLVQHAIVGKGDAPIAERVTAHLQSTLNCDPARVVVRHLEVGESPGGGGKTEVICFVVAKEMVMRVLGAVRQARYEVIGAHSEHVALARAFDRVTRRESDNDYMSMYLDVGAGASKIVLTHGRRIVFAKTIQVAGREFDDAVAKYLKKPTYEARARRLAMGRDIPRVMSGASAPAVAGSGMKEGLNSMKGGGVAVAEDRRSSSPTPGMTAPITGDAPSDLSESLREPIDALVAEVSMCLRYHERRFGEHPVGRCVFVGGEARDVTLCREIAQRLRLAAQVADPLACVVKTGKEPVRGIDFSGPQPGWAVPFGLSFAPRNL